ncbi:MAG: DegT/DnrJ/EryC1/StrS family aminotransferase [Candidatus Omnitrophica bacterium]|nr:DegT/DnrJ/EryC1/StrS family aminotransferase [Candidatus Omnitrophota bacterium]
MAEALDTNRLSAGLFIGRFERAFAAEHGCRHAVMCNSGTSALQIALAALKEQHGWQDGDEILVPAVTFVATSNIVLQNRLTPVFVDADPVTYNLDPGQIERHLTPRTRAIIPAHLFGLPCDMTEILAIAARHHLEVLEDSCETMFVTYRGQKVGAFGALSCFSTYVAHLLVTGVGGVVTTNDDELAVMCRSMMAHGRDAIYLSIDDDDALGSDAARLQMIQRRFSFIRMGYSYRATELEGALGVAALEEKDAMMRARRANSEYLIQRLASLKAFLQLPTVPPDREHAFMMFPLVVKPDLDRDALLNELEGRGIETRYMMPLLNQPYYRRLFGDLEDRYPVAKHLNHHGFYIGCHQGLTREDLDYVVEAFTTCLHSAQPAAKA